MGRKRKAAIEEEEEEDTSNLPCEEVIFIILTKLPVKSLLRFRCVCKSWCALISEPYFIKTHLNESIKSDRRRLVYINSEEINFPVKRYRQGRVVCSCNGLVLLGNYYDKMYVLWNPSTRKYKKFSCPYSVEIFVTYSGMCYNSSTDDYKVVFFARKRNGISSYFVVYTFKSNTWTDIRDFPNFIPFLETGYIARYVKQADRAGLAINGAPHWVLKVKRSIPTPTVAPAPAPSDDSSETSSSDDTIVEGNKLISTGMNRTRQSYWHDCDNNYVIVYFDFVEETFKEVPPPYWLCEGDVFGLTVIRGRLSLYISTNDFKLHEIWTMKEYGERNSWSKLISIPTSEKRPISLGDPIPLCSTKKDNVVMLYHSSMELVLYNPKKNKWRNITHLKYGIRCFSSLVSYVDTLVLLPTRDKLTKRQRQKRQGEGKES